MPTLLFIGLVTAVLTTVDGQTTSELPEVAPGRSLQRGAETEPKPGLEDQKSIVVGSPLPSRSKVSERKFQTKKFENEVEQRKRETAVQERAQQTVELVQESFNRGLMSLPDYADAVEAVLEIRIAIADRRQDRALRVRALQLHPDSLKTTSKLMRQLNQPSAAGWAADSTYAAMLATNAELRLSVVRNDQDAFSELSQKCRQLAQEHYLLRKSDFESGLATLPQFSRAAGYLTTNLGQPHSTDKAQAERHAEYLTHLRTVVDQTQKLRELGAGVGREDRLHQAQFELAKAEWNHAQDVQDSRRAEQSIVDATQALRDWYASQRRFYQFGTASLRDLINAWWAGVELQDLIQGNSFNLPEPAELKLRQNSDDLSRVLQAITDKQGRIAADIAFANSLRDLNQLWIESRHAADVASPTFEKRPPANAPRGRSLILDFTKSEVKETTGAPPENLDAAPFKVRDASPQIEISKPSRKAARETDK